MQWPDERGRKKDGAQRPDPKMFRGHQRNKIGANQFEEMVQ